MCIILYALFLSYVYYLFSRYVLSLLQTCNISFPYLFIASTDIYLFPYSFSRYSLFLPQIYFISSSDRLHLFSRFILSILQMFIISFPDPLYLFSRCVLCFFHMCIITFPYPLSLLQIGFISLPDLLLDPLYLFSRSILSFYDMHFVSSQICFIFFSRCGISSPDWLHLSSRSALSLP